MIDKFPFTLVSPEKTVFSDHVSMVVLPGEEGDFGVLPRHADLISLLRPGLIYIYQEKAIFQRIYVEEGIANVNEKGCNVIATECIFLQNLDRIEVESLIKEKLKEIEVAHSEQVKEALKRDLHFANIKLQVLTKYLDG
jgi:F-type H+-transporting ATPase subunit epsilon